MSISFYFYNKYLTYVHEVFGIIIKLSDILKIPTPAFLKLLMNGTSLISKNYFSNN